MGERAEREVVCHTGGGCGEMICAEADHISKKSRRMVDRWLSGRLSRAAAVFLGDRGLDIGLSVTHGPFKAVGGRPAGHFPREFAFERANLIVTGAMVFYNVHGESYCRGAASGGPGVLKQRREP